MSLSDNEGSSSSSIRRTRSRRRMSTFDEGRFLRARNRKLNGTHSDVRNAPVDSNEDDAGYTFVQLADTQFGMVPDLRSLQWLRYIRNAIEYATCGKYGPSLLPVPKLSAENELMDENALLELEIEMSRLAVKAINKLRPKPKFAVVCGDLVHAYPDKQRTLNEQQVKIFKQVFSQIDRDIEIVCCCGNHDIGDRPNPKAIALWKSRFGDDYFSFFVNEDKYIVLNSQLYKDGSLCQDEYKEQDQWLDQELFGEDNRRHTVLFSHIPPFINSPDEPSGYFPLAKPIRKNLLNRAADAQVSHWFSGHYHRNAVGRFKSRTGNVVEVVTTGAVGGNIKTDKTGDALGLSGMGEIGVSENTSGLRIVNVSSKGISHDFFTLGDLRKQLKIK